MSFFNKGFRRRRFRKKSLEEPLFTGSLLPSIPRTILVYANNNTTLCWDLLHVKELLFKKSRLR